MPINKQIPPARSQHTISLNPSIRSHRCVVFLRWYFWDDILCICSITTPHITFKVLSCKIQDCIIQMQKWKNEPTLFIPSMFWWCVRLPTLETSTPAPWACVCALCLHNQPTESVGWLSGWTATNRKQVRIGVGVKERSAWVNYQRWVQTYPCGKDC